MDINAVVSGTSLDADSAVRKAYERGASGTALEQLADAVVAERRAQFKRRAPVKTNVPRLTAAGVIPTCSRCGAVHHRYRDATHTKPAGYCGRCASAYARTYMRARRAALKEITSHD